MCVCVCVRVCVCFTFYILTKIISKLKCNKGSLFKELIVYNFLIWYLWSMRVFLLNFLYQFSFNVSWIFNIINDPLIIYIYWLIIYSLLLNNQRLYQAYYFWVNYHCGLPGTGFLGNRCLNIYRINQGFSLKLHSNFAMYNSAVYNITLEIFISKGFQDISFNGCI